MAFTVTINYGAGDVALTNYSGQNLVYTDTLKKTIYVHSKDFKPSSGQAWFSIQPNSTLMADLWALDRDQLITVTILDGATPWFKGYVRPVTTFKDSTGKKTLDIECVDAGWLLHKKPDGYIHRQATDSMTVCNTSSTSTSMIHWLLVTKAGFTGTVNAFNISTSIPHFMSGGKEYFEILSDLCFSYHCSFYFDASGNFNLYDWGVAAGSITSTATLTESNMIDELVIKRSEILAETPAVKYYRQAEKTDHQFAIWNEPFVIAPAAVVTDTGGTTSIAGYTGVPVAGSYYHNMQYVVGDDLDGIGDCSLKTTATLYAYFYSNPHWRTWQTSVKITSIGNILNGGTGSQTVDYGNNLDLYITHTTPNTTYLTATQGSSISAGTHTAFYTSFETYGRAWIAEEAGRALGPDVGSGEKEYKARYCYSETDAKTLATALSRNLETGDYKYTWRSTQSLTLGAYYTVNNTEANKSAIVRITKKTNTYKDPSINFYEYEAMEYSGLGTVFDSIIDGTETPSTYLPVDIPSAIVGADLPSTTDFEPAQNGLYLTADKMGYYSADDMDWKAVINNDGTFKFDGDGSSFIEWDGSSLAIKGDLTLSGSSTLAGTITAGEDIQSSNYSPGVSGWTITGNGDAEFNTVTIRSDDIQEAIVGASPVDYADYQAAVPEWMYVLRLDGTMKTTDGTASTTGGNATFSTTYTKFTGSSLFASSGSGFEFATLGTISQTRADSVSGGFGWFYITSLPSLTKTIILSGNMYIQVTSAGKLQFFMNGTTPKTFTSTASIPTNQWVFLSAWYTESADIVKLKINGTIESTVSAGVTSPEIFGGSVYCYVFNADDSFTCYASEAGFIRSHTTIDPDLYFEDYRNGTEPWNELFKPHAFNFAGEISSSDGIYPQGFIFGLETSAATDTDHDVTIDIGSCRDRRNRRNINLTEQITKRIDATWAAGSGSGGLFYGSVSANTTYHFFVIRKDSDGSTDAGWDSSSSCTSIPSGYTAYRRIRSYVTDASANIIQTVQHGDDFIMYRRKYDLDLRNGSPAWSGTTNNVITLSVPTGLSVMAKITANYMDSNVGYVELRSPSCVAQSETLAYTAAGSIFVRDSGLNNSVEMQILTNTSGQIYANTSDTTPNNFTVATIGWNDTRGRFGGV
jgi:hypothetical protein